MITLHNKDCLEGMQDIDDNTIDLTLTSPPYDNLRDYNGYSFDFENTAKELYRVTKQGGIVVWIVGDETKNFCESLSSFKQAIYFVEACGFKLLDTMIYQKKSYPPAYPNMRRYAQNFEYMFVFSKGKPKTFNPQYIARTDKDKGKKKTSSFRQKDGTLLKKTIAYDTDKPKKVTNVWLLDVGYMKSSKDKISFDHPATFPEELAKRHILTWSNKNDIVFDPFMGSGTTAKMCLFLDRNFIGHEISNKYYKIAKQRLDNHQQQIKLKI